MKFYLFLGTLFSCFTSVAQSLPIQDAFDTFIELPDLEGAAVSFEAVNMEDEATVLSYNANMRLAPASTVKLFTTATAYLHLDTSYQPSTHIFFDGVIDSSGVLQGNIVVKGGGDPSLGSRFFEKEGLESRFLDSWVTQLKKVGLKAVNGSVIADGSDYGYSGVPDGWSWSDIGNYYGASPSGCVVYDNMIRLRFKTGNDVGDSTWLISTQPNIPGYELENYVSASTLRYDNSYVYGAPYQNSQFIAGTLPIGKSSFEVKASMPDPEFILAFELSTALEKSGVKISLAPKGYRTIKRFYSLDKVYKKEPTLTFDGKNLSSIAYFTNKNSVNLFAEQIMCWIGEHTMRDASTKSGVLFTNQFWSTLFKDELFLTDGSGLSRSNAVSSHQFVSMLLYMKNTKYASNFRYTLPVVGESGTLARLCKNGPARGRVMAKSGTMNRIKSYAGYVNSISGKKIAFSIIVNNFSGSSRSLTQHLEKIFNALAIS
ncbi:MAG: D-alanyl-D-alanine carboxypeptidase/D-alanyl-D-alanine endopeptidase [Lishizhenia sp.]